MSPAEKPGAAAGKWPCSTQVAAYVSRDWNDAMRIDSALRTVEVPSGYSDQRDSKEMDFFFMLQISRCLALAELEPPANNPSI